MVRETAITRSASSSEVVIWKRPGVIGSALGLLAAVAYTTANLGLRNVAQGGDFDWAIFVSANKAAPVALIAWGLVGWRSARGLPGLPPRHLVLPLLLTGLVMQFGGNVMFQYALSRGGLALTVPLTFSTIILSGAILGRIVLKEPLSGRMLLAMATMMGAVAVLSQGAEAASGALVANAGWQSTVLAIVSACVSGCGYGSCGVMVRRCVTSNLSYSATIVFISSVGLFVLWPISAWRLGVREIASIDSRIWLSMLAAGLANAVAFFSINAAYKRLSVVRVNLLNASQAALAAIAGVVLFAEPNTWWLRVGTAMTVLGLILSARRERPALPRSAPPDPTTTETAYSAPALLAAQDHAD